ncbi:MAG: 2Fe-2S iron-sulfur cluster-binding protein [Sulfurovum sp.]
MKNLIKPITVTIDGKVCKSTFGETILTIARENDIYIPTMCYLTKVKPIASCRMCIVDVEGVDGVILSCQEKATNGAVITTQSASLHKERTNIMKLYNVNHPLECGVCDQSGECDLQNKTLEFGLNDQPFTTRDQHRPVENWGLVSYDPALCIMCEKCVRVSTEITGDEALELKFGGYSSTIINNKKEKNYASLGEAASVCPVGALVDSSFKYSVNAWELQKIPTACTHCGAGCSMSYEVKDDTIYRVSNPYEFSSLCGAGRYGFEYANKDVTKNKEAFNKAVEAFKDADSIIFAPQITNEEALILQKIKEKYSTKLISHEARAYQNFIQAYSQITGKSLPKGNLENIAKSNGVIILGTRINDDNPMIKYHINMASKWNRARVIYMHSIEDIELKNIVTQFIKYEVGSEEGVTALLVDTLLKDVEIPAMVREFLEDLDIGNLSAESNVGEEELEDLNKSLNKKSNFSLVVGSDLYSHPQSQNIAKLLALLEREANFNVICVPPTGNGMGVSLICDLDDTIEGTTIGYNAKADFVLSALGDGDLDMPSLTQQEGTLTTLEARVVTINAGVSYGGYELNDIANALDISSSETIDYTECLPIDNGFKSEKFDDLPDEFDITGVENRGYLLTPVKRAIHTAFDEISELEAFDGAVVYNCNSKEQFSPFTNLCKPIEQEPLLLGSQQFATVTKLKGGEKIAFDIDGVRFERVFKIDPSMKGTIALNPTYDMGLSTPLVSSYRFNRLKFDIMKNEKVGNNDE